MGKIFEFCTLNGRIGYHVSHVLNEAIFRKELTCKVAWEVGWLSL